MEERKNKNNFLRIFSVIGSIASILGLIVIFLPKNNSLELSVTTSLVENLTDKKLNDPNLKAIYTFKGDTINNLWKVVVELKNNSDESFIISEKIRNIIDDSIHFSIKKNLTLIDYKLIEEDFPNSLSINSNRIDLTFKQWKPQEKIKLFIYVQAKNEEPINVNIFEDNQDRSIIDGNIQYYYSENGNEKKVGAEFIPNRARKYAFVISIIVLGLISLILILLCFGSIIGYVSRKKWNRNNLEKYNQFIKVKYSTEDEEYQKYVLKTYLNKPESFNLWSEFDGPKFPIFAIDFEIDNFLGLIIAEAICFVIILSSIITAIDLYILFP